jgi:hypothetical protein
MRTAIGFLIVDSLTHDLIIVLQGFRLCFNRDRERRVEEILIRGL